MAYCYRRVQSVSLGRCNSDGARDSWEVRTGFGKRKQFGELSRKLRRWDQRFTLSSDAPELRREIREFRTSIEMILNFGDYTGCI